MGGQKLSNTQILKLRLLHDIGWSNKEIAQSMNISRNTAWNQVRTWKLKKTVRQLESLIFTK